MPNHFHILNLESYAAIKIIEEQESYYALAILLMLGIYCYQFFTVTDDVLYSSVGNR